MDMGGEGFTAVDPLVANMEGDNTDDLEMNKTNNEDGNLLLLD